MDSDGAPVKGSEKYYEKYNDGNYSDQNATNKITSITKPQWPGYTFGGYYSSKKGTGTKYIDADGKILAGNTAFLNDTTLYAKWTANAYTIKFHANGGTGTMADMNVKFDDLVTLRTNTFRRTGYSFKGWATSANGDAVYTDKDTVKELTTTDNGVIDLYAVWEENIYTITLNGDGATTQGTEKYYEKYATGNYLKDTCASGETVGTITKPVKPGFVFHGYYSSREGLGTKYIDKDGKILSLSSPAYTEFASDTTLYAYWTPNQYTIKYDSNGGTGSMQDTVATYGVPVTLRTNTFSNEGKTFSGWSLTPDGPVVYENKELVTDLTMENGSVVMLYAQWTANRYIITLNDDGATFPGTTRYCEKYGVNNYATTDCTVAIASIIRPKKDGYIFNGYYTGKNGTGTKYIDANGKILCLSSPAYTEFKTDTTLYADWTVTEYTIAYDPNGGSGSIPTTFAYYEEDVSLEPNTFVHTGKSFVGWALTKMGPVVYKDKQTVRNLNTTNGETIMLYAVWKEDVYTITLNSDGAPIKGTTEYFEKYSIQNYKKHPDQSTEVITAITKPVWTGRVFMGYYTEKDGTGTQYIDANGKILTTSTTFVADTTLFAGWKNAEYMIKYDANGGTGTMANTSATYNADVELRKHAFIRTGYMFVGWATSSTGPVVYKDKEMVRNLTATNGDTVILYAVWERILVMISLDSQTGTDGTEAFFEKYGLNFYLTNALKDVISNITVPVKIGYSFGGYFAGGEGSGDAHIDANGNIKVPNTTYLKETSLFAKWLAKQFIITFNKQGGTQGSDSVTATYSQILPAADAPQRVGFTFKGYYTGTNGTGTKYYDEFVNTSIVYQQLKNLTLYAYWEDTFAPDITLNVSTGKWTKDPVTLTAYVVDNGVGLAGVEIYLINQDGSLTLVADATGLNGTKLKELTFVNTKEGVVRYKAVATDLNGNKSESYNTVYYDTKAPTGSVIEFDVNGTIFDIIIDITDISTGN